MTATKFPIPHQVVPWLLGCFALPLVLHISHLPWWLWGWVVVLVGWRAAIHFRWLNYPSASVKTVTVVLAVGLLLLNLKGFNLESAASFLIAASVLKLIEMRFRRDGYAVIFLGFFMLAVGFLFEQDISSALLGMLAVGLLLATLINLHLLTTQSFRPTHSLKVAVQMLALSLPMMLVLYLLFPRLAPLWNFSLQSGQARTGLSDDMSVADIAELSQSSELAFRASFANNQVPAREQLYWRALLLDYYDGRRWSVRHNAQVDWTQASTAAGIQYEIIQEPTHKNWLFALDQVQALEARTGVTDDQRLVARRPVFQRLRYRAQSFTGPTPYTPLSAQDWREYTQLPAKFNPQSRQWAQQRYAQAGTPQQFATDLMRFFAEEAYSYTLKPQRLGEHEIDEFLFITKQGFCSHYAGAMTFLARAAGIPARVVTGYQGGEWNATERYLTVRQFDAHAWVELWFEGRGWQRFDPTAMIASDRIMFGLERAVAGEGTFLQGQFSAYHLQRLGWLNRLRLSTDAINYAWQKWVLAYDNERQSNFLQGVLRLKDYQQGLYLIALSFALFFVLASGWLWWRQRPSTRSLFMRQWLRLQCIAEQRQGVTPASGETAGQYCQRLAVAVPSMAAEIQRLAQQINRNLYQPVATADVERNEQELVRQLRKLANNLPKHKSR